MRIPANFLSTEIYKIKIFLKKKKTDSSSVTRGLP
jgi:hypothetical protein